MNGYSISELESFIQRFYPNRRLLMTPYGYPLGFTGLATDTNATAQLQISANADFCLLGIAYHADVAQAGQTVSTKTAAIGRILITDTGSNEQFTQGAVDIETYCSNGNVNPAGVLAFPRIVGGRSVLQVQVFNDDAAQTYNLNFNFWGVLVRAYSGA